MFSFPLSKRLFVPQEIEGFTERSGYNFNLFSGENIRLEAGGSFFVDGQQCTGALFEGASKC